MIRPALCLAIAVLAGASPLSAQNLLVPDRPFVAANNPTVIRFALPFSPAILGIDSATITDGDLFVLAGPTSPPDPVITALVTATGASNPALVTLRVVIGESQVETWTAQLQVNPVPNNPPQISVNGVADGGSLQVATSPFQLQGQINPFNGLQDYELRLIVVEQNLELELPVLPSGGVVQFAAPIALVPGQNSLFLHAHDRNCPPCDGDLFAFSVVWAHGGRVLDPQYLSGTRESFGAQACFRPVERCGGGPSASTGCPPYTQAPGITPAAAAAGSGTYPIGVTLGYDRLPVNVDPSSPCRAYWSLELLSLPGRGIPLVEGISYNSDVRLGPDGYHLGQAPWSTWWTQRILPAPLGSYRRFDGRQERIDLWTDRGDGLYTSPEIPAVLRVEPDGTFKIRLRDGQIQHFHALNDPVAPGAIISVEDPHGNRITCEYEPTPDQSGRLKRIIDTYGAPALEYFYRPDGYLERIRDITTRDVVLSYDDEERLEGARSPVGEEFPEGRRFRFGYVPHSVLLHRVVYPNEVAAALDEARLTFFYDSAGCVFAQRLGGTNASGIAAGGTSTIENGVRDGVPFSRTTDRRGHIVEQEYDAAGRCLKQIAFTHGLRPTGPYVTTYAYSPHGWASATTLPEGNSLVTTYRSNPNPYQIVEVEEVRRFAGPRGGDQTEIAVRYEHEALFNKLSRVEDPRRVDPFFAPPFGSTSYMVTTTVYEYQEGGDVPPREQGWGLSAADLVLNEPDRNGNGLGASGCSTIQSIAHPTCTLPDGSTPARVSLFGFNAYGQILYAQDPGGVRTAFDYHPESDLNGQGDYPIADGDPLTGGFQRTVTRDTLPSIYGAAQPITTRTTFNRIGDPIRRVDGRGIASTLIPNEIHLVREIIAADDTSEQPGQRNETEAAPALSIRTVFTRDANDNVIAVAVDNRGNHSSHDGAFITTRTVLDILDHPLSIEREVTETETVTTTLRYDANENLTSTTSTQVPHTHTRTTYDERNIVLETFRGVGAEEARYATEVDLNGNIITVISPVDRAPEAGAAPDGERDRVRTEFDGFDRPRTRIDALGNFTRVFYDPASQVIATETYGHPPNVATAAKILLAGGSMDYDEAGRVVKSRRTLFVDEATQLALVRPAALDTDDSSDPNHVAMVCTYDVNSLKVLSQVANRASGVEELIADYDGHARVRRQTDAEGNSVELIYDNNHGLVRSIETDVQPEGEIAAETFESALVRDALGRVTQSTDPKGAVRRFEWGTLYPHKVRDALGNISRTRRDGLARVTRTIRELTTTGKGGAPLDTSNPDNPDGLITTTFGFNDSANRTRVEDDRGNATRDAEYDSRGNLLKVTYADGTKARTTFDLGDAAVSVKDQAGNVFTHTIDPLGRLVQTDIQRAAGFVGTTQITRAFDGLSRLTHSFDNGGQGALAFDSVLDCRYDSLGNMLEESHNGRVVSREYKSDADPVALTYPDGTRIDYQTDRLNRLTELNQDSASVASWRYVGQRTHRSAWGNGTSAHYTYDNNRRLKRLKHKRGGTTFLDYQNGYNAEDYLVWERRHHEGGTGLQVQLDSTYRITSYRDGVADPSGAPQEGSVLDESFTLDGLGNWNSHTTKVAGGTPETVTTAINEMNEYTQFGADSQTHDDNGNRTTDDRHRYEWDALGRLRALYDKTTDAVVATYSYHADGRRTRKSVTEADGGTRKTLFAWDGMRMCEEAQPNGAVRARTVWGRGWEHARHDAGGERFFYHPDAKGWIASSTGLSTVAKVLALSAKRAIPRA